MPTYEYCCDDCGATVERWQHFNDSPLVHCSLCGGSLRRVFSPVGIIFKGKGWYCTDSRSKSKIGSEVDSSSTSSKPAEATAAI